MLPLPEVNASVVTVIVVGLFKVTLDSQWTFVF